MVIHPAPLLKLELACSKGMWGCGDAEGMWGCGRDVGREARAGMLTG